MESFIIVREFSNNLPTSKVIMFSKKGMGGDRTHIRRIEKISAFRYVGSVTSQFDLADITSVGGINDAQLFRRNGVDVRDMMARRAY